MVSGGRIVCVALPFVVAVVSLVMLLIAGLAGVNKKSSSLYVFEVNMTGFSISDTELSSLLSKRSVDVVRRAGTTTSTSSNITASDLNFANVYQINVWNYCETTTSNSTNCSAPAYNWAAGAVNASEASLESMAETETGSTLTLPSYITEALKIFVALSRWTQILFIIAFVALALQIIVGLFTSCSRAIACLTYLIALITSAAVAGAAGLATGLSIVVVAVVKDKLESYGVTAKVNTSYLVVVWIAAALAMAASFFWAFTICCCKPDSGSRRNRNADAPAGFHDKNAPAGSYVPLQDPHQSGYYNNGYVPQYGAPRQQASGRSDLAYEPYSHSRV